MDNINSTTNNENVLPKFKTPGIFYGVIASIVFFIIVMILIASDFNITSLGSSQSKSDQEFISNIFIILFFSLLVFGICIIFLPNFKEFKQLFEQIGNVTFVILYTIFAILFYTMISKDILNNYYYIINPIMLGLGAFSFYKGTSDNYIDKFNVNYERIKMLILLFCLITIVITFYNINPGGSAEKYFGYSMLLTIIISVFAFFYVVVLLTLPDKEGSIQQNLLNNFSIQSRNATRSTPYLSITFMFIVTQAVSVDVLSS